MKASQFLKANRISLAEFAREHDKPYWTLYGHVSGRKLPSPEYIAWWSKVTHGAVAPADFYDLEPAAAESEPVA